MYTVVIDPGHGGETRVGGSSPNNATGPSGLKEKTVTLAIAKIVQNILQSNNTQVILTRECDDNLGLAERADIARRANADIFVSIHCNGWHSPSVQGTETYHHTSSNEQSRQLASTVQSAVLGATGLRNRGVKSANFGVLRPDRHAPETASCLLEISFLTDPTEEARLMTEAYRNRIASAISVAITEHLGTSTSHTTTLGMRNMTSNENYREHEIEDATELSFSGTHKSRGVSGSASTSNAHTAARRGPSKPPIRHAQRISYVRGGRTDDVLARAQTQQDTRALGWVPDMPDIRDFTLEKHDKSTGKLLSATAMNVLKDSHNLPSQIDLRGWCSEIEDQGSLGSCTAHAVIGMIEYLMMREKNEVLHGSKLFLYKVTRNLMNLSGDTGATIRDTIKACVLFGVPPEEQYGYDIRKFEDEPDSYLYSFAANFKALKYLRLDPVWSSANDTISHIKNTLVNGNVAAFGFPVYDSIAAAHNNGGHVPLPSQHSRLQGGHAILAVGYDDDRENIDPYGNVISRGSLIFRNSWGHSWGDSGYGYLPYEYLYDGLARDFWTILVHDWIEWRDFD